MQEIPEGKRKAYIYIRRSEVLGNINESCKTLESATNRLANDAFTGSDVDRAHRELSATITYLLAAQDALMRLHAFTLDEQYEQANALKEAKL